MYIPQTKKMAIASIALVATLAIATIAYFVFFPRGDAPHFSKEYGVTLVDYDGTEVPLSHFRYSPIVVFMWASWCPYCSAELQNLVELKKKYGDSIEVLAVNRAEPLSVAKEFTDVLKEGNTLHFLLDPNDALYHSIGGYAMPETIFVDTSGEILFHQRGPVAISDVDEWMKHLRK